MEAMTGIMIALLIFISAKLVINNELEVSNFFSFLAAMMLAYQPVRSLATLNIGIQQGIAGAKRIIPILDDKWNWDNGNTKDLTISEGSIEFHDKISFNYNNNENGVLRSINLKIPGQKWLH